jgi:hypothetical protein
MFYWIPSHIGKRGHTKTDTARKQALQPTIRDFEIPYTDLKYSIGDYVNLYGKLMG